MQIYRPGWKGGDGVSVAFIPFSSLARKASLDERGCLCVLEPLTRYFSAFYFSILELQCLASSPLHARSFALKVAISF
jgi:hypothetical protein